MKKLLYIFFGLISVSAHAQTQITTAAQLQNMSLTGDYILMNDIELSSFNPIGGQYGSSFTGTFDGNGHTITIKGVSSNDYAYRGLFSQIGTDGVVKNIKVTGNLDNAPEKGCYVGGIAAWNSGTIINCSSSVYINSSTTSGTNAWICWSGCIAGINKGTITYCFANGGMYGAKNNAGTGGIVGVNSEGNAKIENCIYVGNIEKYYGTTSTKYGMICGCQEFSANTTNSYYLDGQSITGIGANISDEGHCTALSQIDIRALAKTGGVYASTTNDVFKGALLTFPYTINFIASDGIDVFNSIKGEHANVTFRRDATKNVKCTICLPFDVPQEQLANLGKFYEFSGIKPGTANVVQMSEVTTGLQANTAYVFEPKYGSGEETIYTGYPFKDVIIANSLTPIVGSGDFLFTGTYEAKTWSAGDPDLGKVYGFAIAGYDGFTAGDFVMIAAGASAAPFRGYLKYTGSGYLSGAEARKRASETLPEVIHIEWISASGSTTGISNINTITPIEDSWYSLDGHRFIGKPTQKGIYVNNGKKVIIK